jgi:hypothetical protein
MLSDYTGQKHVNMEYLIKRRELRYKLEALYYAVFGFEKKKNENKENIIFKGFISSKPRETQRSKSELLDRECEVQTIDRQSTVDKPLVASVHKDMNKNHIGRQSQGVESSYLLFDRKSCVALATDSKSLIEKAHHFIVFRKSYVKSSIKKIFRRKMINQRSLFKSVQECDFPSFFFLNKQDLYDSNRSQHFAFLLS